MIYLKKLWKIFRTKQFTNVSQIDKVEEISQQNEGHFDWWMKYQHSLKKNVCFTGNIIHLINCIIIK